VNSIQGNINIDVSIRTVAVVSRPMTSEDTAADTHSTPLRAGSFYHYSNQTTKARGEVRGNLLSQQVCVRVPTGRSIYRPLPAALSPSLIASCSVTYLPFFVVP
jgi:hypothetical protein